MSHADFAIFFPGCIEKPRRIILKGYASRYNRIDVLARLVSMLAEMGSNATVHGFVRVDGNFIRIEAPIPRISTISEKTLVKDILVAVRDGHSGGIRAVSDSPERFLHEYGRKGIIVRLSERGEDISRASLAGYVLLVMGAHREPEEEIEEIIRRYANLSLSIGPYSYLASHTAGYIAWRLMRGVESRGAK